MQAITITVPDSTIESLDEIARDEYDGNRSEAVRALLEKGIGYDDLEADNERLRHEKQVILDQRDEHTDLVRYVEEEMSYRDAELGTRMKWWLFGKDN